MAAWRDTEALIRATARVERKNDTGGWSWRGTAFFVAERTLLTCAHVVMPGEELRVVWHGGEKRSELAVSIAGRYPDHDPAPDGPYPLPDLAVLQIGDEDVGEHPIAWLDTDSPGEDLWAFGYTDEYREGMALGHSVRFENAGESYADDDGGMVWHLGAGRVKPGMSGAPVLDLGTGRVVAIMKRTQDAIQAIGGFATGMARIHGKIPELFDANDKANSTETRDQDLAQALWGPRVRDAAEPLIHSAAARDAIIELLELPDKELHGDPKLDAERIARELFVRDLETLAECVTRLTYIVNAEDASKVFRAVATCTSHEGGPWVATVAAAELSAQVDLLSDDATAGRLLHLRSGPSKLTRVYVDRGNRARTWGRPLETTIYSHIDDPESGLPADVERELRISLLQRLGPNSELSRYRAEVLDDESRQRWDDERPKLLKRLRGRGVVASVSCARLDAAFVDALLKQYPLVFLVAMGADVSQEVRDLPVYQPLDPDIDEERAGDALNLYDFTTSDLAGGGP